MVKPIASRPRKPERLQPRRFGRFAGKAAALLTLAGALSAVHDPYVAQTFKSLAHWPPRLPEITSEKITRKESEVQSFAEAHGLPVQDSLSLYIAHRNNAEAFTY